MTQLLVGAYPVLKPQRFPKPRFPTFVVSPNKPLYDTCFIIVNNCELHRVKQPIYALYSL